jgi:hypothetical protein
MVPKALMPKSAAHGSAASESTERIKALADPIKAIVIVAAALVVIVIVVREVMKMHPETVTATDVVAILSPIIGAIATIAAAAFGVATGAAVGAAAGKSAADTAMEGAEATVENQRKLGQQVANEMYHEVNRKQRKLTEAGRLQAEMGPHLDKVKNAMNQDPKTIDRQGVDRAFTELDRISAQLEMVTRD